MNLAEKDYIVGMALRQAGGASVVKEGDRRPEIRGIDSEKRLAHPLCHRERIRQGALRPTSIG